MGIKPPRMRSLPGFESTPVLDAFFEKPGCLPGYAEPDEVVWWPEIGQRIDKEEEQAMIDEFWEFDRRMIHEKYESVVDELERPRQPIGVPTKPRT